MSIPTRGAIRVNPIGARGVIAKLFHWLPLLTFGAVLPVQRHASFTSFFKPLIEFGLYKSMALLFTLFGSPCYFHGFAMTLSTRMTHFSAHIREVIGVSAKKQMVRIKAKFNITRVANAQTIRNLTNKNTVRNPVNISGPVYVPSLAIAPALSAREQPAITIYRHFLHKAVNGRTGPRAGFHKHIIPQTSDAIKGYS